MPSSLTELGTCAFFGCKALSEFELPEATEMIGKSAFSGCTTLTSFPITKEIRSIGISAFEGCTGLLAFTVDAANQYFSADTEGNLYNEDQTAFLRRPPANTAESFVLPDSVKTIDYAAFEDCTNLKSIEYSPDNVEKIGSEAFYSSGLTAARIFAGITYGSDVFRNCQQLKDVSIEEGASGITAEMFAYCTSLEQISIPDSVTYIGSAAFSSCTMLQEITIGNGVKNIYDWAFIDCTALQEINISDSVETIGYQAFSGCTALTTVTIGSGMRYISSHAFEKFYKSSGDVPLENLTVSPENSFYSSENNVLFNKEKTELILYPAGITGTEYILPDTICKISDSAFANNTSLTKLIFNQGLEEIADQSFNGCTALAEITIPDSVKDIGTGAFADTAFYQDDSNWTDGVLYNGGWLLGVKTDIETLNIKPDTFGLADRCLASQSFFYPISLKTISVPDSVQKIYDGTFRDCEYLESITVDAGNELYSSENGVLYDKEKTRLLAFPAAFNAAEFTIPSTVETVAPYAFYDNKTLTSVTVPSSVKTIENDAFSNCSNLETLHLNEGLVSIGEYAFYYCDMLDLNTLPNSVTHIGHCAFNDTAAYDNEVNWENDLFYIGNCLLGSRQHTGAEPITVKDGTRLIADYAFSYYFQNVTEIVIPNTVTQIGKDAMLSCDSLERISVSEQNTSFKSVDGVLYNNDVSVLIQYPRKKPETTFAIPDTVTVIRKYAFSSCDTIESITIPASVVSVEDYAFDYCKSLQKIIYCGTPGQWAKISVGTGNGSLEQAKLTYQTASPHTKSEVIRTADGCKVNVSHTT